jgi:hypothetical protein
MITRIALTYLALLASSAIMPGLSHAQFVLPAPSQAREPAAQPPAIPDDVRITLMIRNAVIALNQANITGNYAVLREMGTANFQMTNNPARLAEIFATLRSRKIDLSPIMVFDPKMNSKPALDGQVLRLTGYFPTTPEQVQFDLAYQYAGDQWLLAGIAISVAPPGDDTQASASPNGQLLQATAEPGAPSSEKLGEAKPDHIELDLPAKKKKQRRAAAPKKSTAPRKPKHTAAATPKPAPARQPASPPEAPVPAPVPHEAPPAEASSTSTFGSSWNPFGR